LQWGGGGGVNLTLDGAFNMNPANASISIAPTGTGTLTINPATAGTINNMAIGGTTPRAGAFTTLTASTAIGIASGGTGQTTANAAFNALAPSQTGNSGKYLTTDGTDTSWASNPLGTVTSVAASVPSFLSIAGSPITTSGTLAISLSGTALPTTSGGTGLTSFTANGVAYASSSSALATGSAFNFDGSRLELSVAGAFYKALTPLGSASYFGDAVSLTSGAIATDSSIRFDGTNLLISSANLEKIRVTSTGFIGVANTTPQTLLDLVYSGGSIAGALVSNTTGSGFGLTHAANATPSVFALGFRTTGVSLNGISGSAFVSQIISSTTSSNALELYTTGNTPVVFGTNSAEGLRLTSSSLYTASGINVGFGTSSTSSYKLNVVAAFSSGIGGAYIEAGEFNQSALILNHTNASVAVPLFQVQKSGTGVLTLDSAGNLLVGTPTAYGKLAVAGSIASFASATIGALTANSGYVSYSAYNGSGAYISFQPTNTSGTQFEAAVISSSGNFGLGVTPSSNWANAKAFEIGAQGNSLWSYNGNAGDIRLLSNAYWNNSNYIYSTTAPAAQYQVVAGGHYWQTAPSGSAGTSVPFTTAMMIHPSGAFSVANTSDAGAYNTILGDRNNHFTGQRSNTVAGGATSTMLTITFDINGAAIVRVVDTGTVVTSNYFMNVYEYFVTCYNTVVTVTLKQSQNGGGSGSMITTSTSGSTFSVIQTADASLTTVHDTAVDVLVVSAGNGSHATTSITMAASN
jgi:hypothetical protein